MNTAREEAHRRRQQDPEDPHAARLVARHDDRSGVRAELWHNCKPRLVLPISDGEVEEMLSVLTPVAQIEVNKRSRYREILTDGVDRRRTAFTWSPNLGRLVRVYEGGLNVVTIPTFHGFGAPSFFKPSLAEACAAIKHFLPNWRYARFFCVGVGSLDSSNVIGSFHAVRTLVFGPEESRVIDQGWEADERTIGFQTSAQKPAHDSTKSQQHK